MGKYNLVKFNIKFDNTEEFQKVNLMMREIQ